jgi:hypothetical protein
MPKTNDQTGASYAGFSGVVEHGAPLDDGRVLSELDPERNLDGTLIEGDHPDHADGEERTVTQSDAPLEPQPIEAQPVDEPKEEQPEGDDSDVQQPQADPAKHNLGRPAKAAGGPAGEEATRK